MKMYIIYSICAFVLVIPTMSNAATSDITRVVFTTDAREVVTGEISEAITIQTQNGSGEEEKLDSTADVVFTTSSDTGEFVGSTGKAVTKTMNSGSANKTFYYRDSTEGVHVITVQVIPRTGGEGWSVTQNIYVGVASNELSSKENSEGGSEGTSGSESASAHSSSKKASTYKKAQTFKMSAGRNRVVLVNTPIHFEAETNNGDRVLDRSVEFTWSYGDGDGDYGKLVKHIYYFPGEYNVVLTARKGQDESISIIKVKVLDNLLAISDMVQGSSGYIEIENKASSDANIDGWWIVSAGNRYLISGDTIINAKSRLRIPNKVLRFDPANNVEIWFPTKEVAYAYSHTEEMARRKAAEKVAEEEKKVKAEPVEVTEVIVVEQVESPVEFPVAEIPVIEKRNYATTVQAAAVAESGDKGWWAYIKSLFGVE